MSLTPTGFPSGGVFPTGFPGAGGPGGVSISGNTAGTTGLISTGTLILDGGNNITLSQSGNTITIVGGAGGGGGIDLSLSGNTSGTLTLISSGTAILAGGNNITLSQNGQSVTISAFNQSVQTQNLVDVSLSGNTTGTLALVSSGTLILAGGNNISLSQNGQSVTILDGWNTLSNWWANDGVGPQVTIATTDSQASFLIFWPLKGNFFGSASQANQFVSLNISTSATAGSTGAGTLSFWLGAYTRTGSTLSAATTATQTYAWSYTSNISNSNLSGLKMVSIPINIFITPGDYWLAALSLTSSSGNLGFTASKVAAIPFGNFSGPFAGGTNITNQLIPGFAYTRSNGLPASIAFTTITGTNLDNASPPVLNFVNFSA